ncbi:MAG TPA: hypothetical protein VEJ84_04015, partial [Acidimicrobiales bacterium]|nr:hypothetical protein [Acidimicrobiales bacterium]
PTTATTVPPPTTTRPQEDQLAGITSGYGLWGPGGPTGAQFALAGLALLSGGTVLAGLRSRRRATR